MWPTHAFFIKGMWQTSQHSVFKAAAVGQYDKAQASEVFLINLLYYQYYLISIVLIEMISRVAHLG